MRIKKILAFTTALLLTCGTYSQTVFAEESTVIEADSTVSDEQNDGTVTFDKETGKKLIENTIMKLPDANGYTTPAIALDDMTSFSLSFLAI